MDSVTGLLPGQWYNLLRDNGFKISRPGRTALITALSLRNRNYLKKERSLYPAEPPSAPVSPPPLFILGHWRSGTTFLHNLLSLDERLTFPHVYQVNNPHTFLHIRNCFQKELRERSAKKRSMDNIKTSPVSPGEDEFALAVLTLTSPLIGWLFPQRQEYYDRYTTFEKVAPEVTEQWKKSYGAFFSKIQYADPGKPILSKSPLNTARIRLLNSIFPGARFIFIHRHPLQVFKSTRRLYDSAIALSALQQRKYDVDARILKRYAEIHDAYLEQKREIDSDKLLEVSFEELDSDPLKVLQQIYRFHKLEGFDDLKKEAEPYLSGLNHKKNRYNEAEPGIIEKIKRHWEPFLREWNYKL